MANDSPTVRRRQLAAELQELRKAKGFTIEDVAGRLEWDPSKLSRIENRKVGIIVRDLRKLLDLYGVADEARRERMFEMAKQAKQRGWWQAYGDVIPSEYGTLIGLEAEATEIRSYQPELVHGLLQTEAYARAVIRICRPNDTAEQVDRRVEVRLARQQILTRDNPPRVHVVLNEGAVRRLVGGREVMRDQLRHLAAERDRANIIIQVLPFSAGEHPAMTGPFEIIDFPGATTTGVVNVENMTGALSLEREAELDRYGAAFDYISAAALGPKESRDMLIALAEELQ